jgi:S-adenosyl-L-methionine hydrolase (adenosine-forming)
MTQTIALLTDFGTTDPYVGVMKGVMLGIAPELQFVDLTHAVQPQNIKQAAFLLLNSYRFFPAGTIFLVVVDPGVGSTRKAMVVRAGEYTFVAPDNGVLSYVLHELGEFQAVELDHAEYQLAGMSNTFHGRDVFAPAVAHLAAGVALEELGSPLENPVILPDPSLVVSGKHIIGEVLHIDHFGSAVTSIGLLRWTLPQRLALNARFGDKLSLLVPADHAAVTLGKQMRTSIYQTYAEVAQGNVLALVGSSGYLELAVNGGSFAAKFDVHTGDPVEVQIG